MSKYSMVLGKYRYFFHFSGKYPKGKYFVNTPKISSVKSKKVNTLGKYLIGIYRTLLREP